MILALFLQVLGFYKSSLSYCNFISKQINISNLQDLSQ